MTSETNGNKVHTTNAKLNGYIQPQQHMAPLDGGKLIVLTAPLTETIDHAGYFIQMGMASMPIWMEGVMNKKYPQWREVEYNPDGSARYTVSFMSPAEGTVQFVAGHDGTAELTVDGEHVAIDDYPRFDNPYVQADFEARRYEISDGEATLVLDFDELTRDVDT